MPSDNSRDDPLRISATLRQCAVCLRRLHIRNFEIAEDGSYDQKCRSCQVESKLICATEKRAESDKKLARVVEGLVERVSGGGVASNTPDLGKLLRSVVNRLHNHALQTHKEWEGDTAQETAGNFIADHLVNARDHEDELFLHHKGAKLLADLHSAYLRHSPPPVDFDGATEDEVSAALAEPAMKRLNSNDKFRHQVISTMATMPGPVCAELIFEINKHNREGLLDALKACGLDVIDSTCRRLVDVDPA